MQLKSHNKKENHKWRLLVIRFNALTKLQIQGCLQYIFFLLLPFSPHNNLCNTQVAGLSPDDLYLYISPHRSVGAPDCDLSPGPCWCRIVTTHAHAVFSFSYLYINIMKLLPCCKKRLSSYRQLHLMIVVINPNRNTEIFWMAVFILRRLL